MKTCIFFSVNLVLPVLSFLHVHLSIFVLPKYLAVHFVSDHFLVTVLC